MTRLLLLCLLLSSLTLAPACADDGDLLDEDIASLDMPPPQARSSNVPSFAQSKYQLAHQIYKDYTLDFYGGCRFSAKEKRLVPDWNSCGFQPRKNPERAKRIEWEHIVPAWVFGHQLQCWQQGGRGNCRNHPRFSQMEADLHNLVPAIGEINGDRSNLPYGMITGENHIYGTTVNMEIDFQKRIAEPPDTVYGNIARTYFYMRDRYGLGLSSQQTQLFTAWNKLDPVDAWEKQRNQLILKIQGNDNPYISHYQVEPKAPTLPDKTQTESSSTPVFPSQPNDEIDQLYQWIYQYRDQLPYWLFGVITAAYLLYLRTRQVKKTRKTVKKRLEK